MNRLALESLSARTPWDSPYRCPGCGLPCTRDEYWLSWCCGKKVEIVRVEMEEED